MLIISEQGELISSEDANQIAINRFLQELRLWKGENPMDIEAGIDYQAVLNKEAFLSVEINKVVNKYIQYFKDIIVGDIEDSGETIKLPITLWLLDNSTYEHTIELEAR